MSARINGRFDDDAEGYDALRAGRQFERRVEVTLRALDGTSADDLVVEIGAGTGALLATLAAARPDLRFLGVEPLATYADLAQTRWSGTDAGRVRVVQGKAESLADLVDDAAARVVSHDVLHHVESIDHTIRAIVDVTRPDARWIAVEPNRLNPWVAAYHLAVPGERLFNQRTFLASARRAGWHVDERFRMFLIPHAVASPPPALVRLERRYERLPVVSGAVGMVLSRAST